MSEDMIDRIDVLVDEQMAAGEPRQGFDYGDPTYPTCAHCERHWHGLPLTERIVAMYNRGRFEEDYAANADESPVLCEGSDFIGPMSSPPYQPGGWFNWSDGPPLSSYPTGSSPPWLDQLIDATMAMAAETLGIPFTLHQVPRAIRDVLTGGQA